MVDLAPHIRTLILSDPVAASLSTYNGAKAVFTRRPIPVDAQYPFIVVSTQVSQTQDDLINSRKRDLTYDFVVYGQNDTAANYRLVETIANSLARKFARLSRHAMTMPTGVSLVKAIGIGPMASATDDLDKIARAVSVTFTIHMEQ
jgi:hypothetical protein